MISIILEQVDKGSKAVGLGLGATGVAMLANKGADKVVKKSIPPKTETPTPPKTEVPTKWHPTGGTTYIPRQGDNPSQGVGAPPHTTLDDDNSVSSGMAKLARAALKDHLKSQ